MHAPNVEKDKLITIHVNLTTFLATVQGHLYEQLVDDEYNKLKAVVYKITNNTLQVLNLTSNDLAITPNSPQILQPSPRREGVAFTSVILAVESRVCEIS